MPLWVWNDERDWARLKQQESRFKKQGVGWFVTKSGQDARGPKQDENYSGNSARSGSGSQKLAVNPTA
jgi:hypothetical protein